MYGIVSDIFLTRNYSFFFSICPEYKIQGLSLRYSYQEGDKSPLNLVRYRYSYITQRQSEYIRLFPRSHKPQTTNEDVLRDCNYELFTSTKQALCVRVSIRYAYSTRTVLPRNKHE